MCTCHGSFPEGVLSVPNRLRDGGDSAKCGDTVQFNDAMAENLMEGSSLEVKKLDHSIDASNDNSTDQLGLSGSVPSWFDLVRGDGESPTSSVTQRLEASWVADMAFQEVRHESEYTPRSRKLARYMNSIGRANQHGVNYRSEMDDAMPTLIDEKRKRRMSSNRESAQRSRQRKQERLHELEVLTAQLRLENSALLRKSKEAVQLAKKYEGEQNGLTKKVENLFKQLQVVACQPHTSTSESGDEQSVATQQQMTPTISVRRMVGGGLVSPDQVVKVEVEENQGLSTPSDCRTPEYCPSHPDLVAKKFDDMFPVSNGTRSAFFQELMDSNESRKFELGIDGDAQDLIQGWMETFSNCLSA